MQMCEILNKYLSLLAALTIGITMIFENVQAQSGEGVNPPAADTEGHNRLGQTTSPYLLQHQHNPVHWYPWGEEAFKAAREQNKPIFLSIGYSTCYWCHVMERESFENQDVADVLNEYFISVKVDREERPDVDEIYMAAVQLLTRGRGGWPISLFLEPNTLQPFYGGTYFPKEDSAGRRGFITMMRFVNEKWQKQQDAVVNQANIVGKAVVNRLTTEAIPVPLNSKVVQDGLMQLLTRFDSSLGGFSPAPKFPMPSYLDYLMEAGWDLPQVRKAATKTLDSMLIGGIYDQVGGGFHRYSTDENWLVPHFEKMLYDNGQLVSTYAKAYEKTGNPTYAKLIEETLAYVERELSAEEGGFWSAQDAETNHLEGETYLWRPEEIKQALTSAGLVDEIDFAIEVYGLDQGTNFQDPHHLEVPATNVLFLIDQHQKIASKYEMTYEVFQAKLGVINAVLLDARGTRDQPATDDKIITAWNGMMIAGYADAGRILEKKEWVERAQKAADFIINEMRSSSGKLLRTWRQGKGGAEAFLIDYSSLIYGLMSIYEANHSALALEQAKKLYSQAKSLFYVNGNGWFDTEDGKSDLFVRTKALADGAMPAANSLILLDQIALANATDEISYLKDAMITLETQSQMMQSSPLSTVVATRGLHQLLTQYPEKFDEEFEVDMSNPSPVRLSVEPKKLTMQVGETKIVNVKLRMAIGWHVNSNEPINEYAIPISITAVSGNALVEVAWPEGEMITSAGEQVAVFGKSVVFPVSVKATAPGAIAITVTWQACNNDSCLDSETSQIPCTILAE